MLGTFLLSKMSLNVITVKLFEKYMWMCGISILADFRPMGYNLSCCGIFGLGKNLLFKSLLGRCVLSTLQ